MMPFKLYTIYSKASNKHLGYSSQYNTNIFAFVKEDHAIKIRKALKYDSHKIDCVKPDTFIIRNRSVCSNVNKPMNKRGVIIQRFEPKTLAVYLFVNNVTLKIVDNVVMLPSNEFLLESNYHMDIEGDLDTSIKIDVLNSLYNNHD